MTLKLEDLQDVGGLQPPRTGTRAFTSRTVRGLTLVVKPNGRREFHYRYTRPGGTRTTIKLGDHPRMSVAQATDMAAETRAAVRRGVDVVRERRLEEATAARLAAASAALVEPRWRVATLAAEYLAAMEPVLRPSTMERARSLLRKYILAGPAAGWDIRAWPTTDYDALILDISASGHTAVAALLHRTCRAMMGWAVDAGKLQFNPVAGRRSLTRRLRVKPRTEVLSGPVLHTLLNDGPQLYGRLWPLVHFQLLTGLRLGEACALRFDWIDMRARTAKLPAEVMKTKAEVEIVLSDAARAVIVAQRKARPGEPLVFGYGKRVALDELRKLKVPVKRTHTIRRTVATTLQTLGVGEEVRRAILNHAAAQGIGRHYDHAKLRAAQFAALTRLAAHWEAVKTDASAHNADEIVTDADDPLAAEFEALR